jgi:hypothetical protein
MSEVNSPGTDKTGSPKKGVSPVRNVVGIVVLIAVLVIGGFEVSAKIAYTNAVNALNARALDEEKNLLSVQEAESLFGKKPDGPGIDIKENNQPFTKTTYTWQGVFLSYPLTAYYTKGASPGLHHFETEGKKFVPEPAQVVNTTNDPSVAAKTKMDRAPRKAKTEDSAPAKTTTEPIATKTTAEPVPAKTATDPVPAKTTTDPVPAKTPN